MDMDRANEKDELIHPRDVFFFVFPLFFFFKQRMKIGS